jgi:hypothetical protein
MLLLLTLTNIGSATSTSTNGSSATITHQSLWPLAIVHRPSSDRPSPSSLSPGTGYRLRYSSILSTLELYKKWFCYSLNEENKNTFTFTFTSTFNFKCYKLFFYYTMIIVTSFEALPTSSAQGKNRTVAGSTSNLYWLSLFFTTSTNNRYELDCNPARHDYGGCYCRDTTTTCQ